MAEPLLQLCPGQPSLIPLEGAFLGHNLRRYAEPGRAFVYSSFIASLDGRIAQPDPETGLRGVPSAIANSRDWRLLLELVAQADVLLVGDRLLTAFSQGRYPQLWELSGPGIEDLIPWRRCQGLSDRPSIAAASQKLDCLVPSGLGAPERELLLLAPDEAPSERSEALTESGADLLQLGPGPILPGGALVEALAQRGYFVICSVAGPQMLHSLVADRQLQRLYLTFAQVLIGGVNYNTLLHGPALEPTVGLSLSALYFDAAAPEAAGQMLQVLELSSD